MTKLYAIRDRLLDYFMQPFAGPGDKAVLAAVAIQINSQGETNAIAQTPQHFEVWRLAEIDEQTGQVGGERELIADCASLVRPNLRQGRDTGAEEISRSPGRVRGPTPGADPDANTDQRPPPGAPQAENRPGEKATSRPRGTA